MTPFCNKCVETRNNKISLFHWWSEIENRNIREFYKNKTKNIFYKNTTRMYKLLVKMMFFKYRVCAL